MFDMSTLFTPLISTPNRFSGKYVEIMPCDALKPYIKCFWGTPSPYLNKPTISSAVIPEACMDIIFNINYSTNKITQEFCGLKDTPYLPNTEKYTGVISTFGIRFYFWAVHLFAEDGLQNVRNTTTDVEKHFPDFKKSLENILIYNPCIEDRIFHVEHYLLNKLRNRFRENNNVLNAVFCILKAKGVISIPEACEYVCISQRQLERLFSEYIGVSPKKAANLVRYQNAWRDVFLARTTDLYDIVYNYGYSDQAHLLNDFKKHHGMTPLQALNYARQ